VKKSAASVPEEAAGGARAAAGEERPQPPPPTSHWRRAPERGARAAIFRVRPAAALRRHFSPTKTTHQSKKVANPRAFTWHAPRTPLCVNMLLRAQKKNFGENEPRKQFLKSANLVMSRRRMAMLIARVLTARKLQQISVILYLCINVPRVCNT